MPTWHLHEDAGGIITVTWPQQNSWFSFANLLFLGFCPLGSFTVLHARTLSYLWIFFFLPPSRSNGSWNPLDLPLKHIQNVPLLTYLPVSTPVEATISSSLNHCKYFPPWSSFYSCHPIIHCLQSTWSDFLRRQIRLKWLFCLKHLAASLITEGKKTFKKFPMVCGLWNPLWSASATLLDWML